MTKIMRQWVRTSNYKGLSKTSPDDSPPWSLGSGAQKEKWWAMVKRKKAAREKRKKAAMEKREEAAREKRKKAAMEKR